MTNRYTKYKESEPEKKLRALLAKMFEAEVAAIGISVEDFVSEIDGSMERVMSAYFEAVSDLT